MRNIFLKYNNDRNKKTDTQVKKGECNMYKDSSDFREDYPNGYAREGDVYDGNGNHVGYVTGDGDYRITESGSNDGQLYHNK